MKKEVEIFSIIATPPIFIRTPSNYWEENAYDLMSVASNFDRKNVNVFGKTK